MTQTYEDFAKYGKEFADTGLKSFASLTKGAQAIATEAGEYSKKSFEAGTTAVDSPAHTADAVRAELVTVLNLADRPLDPAATLFDLGMDSLLALDLRKRITRVTGRSVALATLLGGITVRELVATFEESDSPT